MINTVHPEWAQKTIAMLNFELPAFYDGASQMEISCVPEYASAVKQFVNEIAIDPEDNIYPKGINDTSVDANTMEDGVSYRHAGVPSFLRASFSFSVLAFAKRLFIFSIFLFTLTVAFFKEFKDWLY